MQMRGLYQTCETRDPLVQSPRACLCGSQRQETFNLYNNSEHMQQDCLHIDNKLVPLPILKLKFVKFMVAVLQDGARYL